MKDLTKEQIQKGLDEAYKKAGYNAYFANGFEAGVAFAIKNLNGEIKKRADVCQSCGVPTEPIYDDVDKRYICPICRGIWLT